MRGKWLKLIIIITVILDTEWKKTIACYKRGLHVCTYLRDSYYVGCVGWQVILALPANFLECRDRRNRKVWVPQSLQHQGQDTAEHHRVVCQPLSQSTWWENSSETEWETICLSVIGPVSPLNYIQFVCTFMKCAEVLLIHPWNLSHL